MGKQTRREFLKTTGLAAGSLMIPRLVFGKQELPHKPNIVLLLADDMGYSDLGCYGSRIQTPNIDHLASQGIRFTDCYSAAPNCSPARAGLLTGRIPSRTGLYSYIPPNHVMHLPRKEITIATLLKQAGYVTCHLGKWHLNSMFNSPEQPQPPEHGFDYWFSTQNNANPSHRNPDNFVRNGKPVGPLEGYSCQIVTDEALDWLKKYRDRKNPFFLFVCFHEPHKKIASPPELAAMYPQATKSDALYYANITNLDLAVGRLMKVLDELNLTQDTFVFFSSDNGPWRPESAGPLRSKKSFLYEGGIRVPGIIRWPGHTKPGSVCGEPISFVDILPTLCKITGANVPADRAIDGANILPVFEGKSIQRNTPLFWYFYRTRPQAAMRQGDWMILGQLNGQPGGSHKMVADDMEFIKNTKLIKFELYNLREDISQQNDLAKVKPQRLKAMKQKLIKLHEEVIAEGPVWDNLPRGGARKKGR